MIVGKSEKPVSASGISSEAFFTVKQENLPWIFGILRNSLYSDKPLAILREYSANALDAHAEAGVPNRPFVVTMPTALSPVLSIRDFGKGLSEDDVYNVFASYGESTKRNTNQPIGRFGIGSKSAFAYVNNFTIVSYFGGKKSIYEAFIDETNIGQVAKVVEEDTNEESGLEIVVNVKVEDIPAFVEAAENLFKHFDTKPIIKNNSELAKFLEEHVAAQPWFGGTTWTFSRLSRPYYDPEIYCFVSNMRYPIPIDKLKSIDIDIDVKSWVSRLYGIELVLRMPVGSVKLNPNRESLEYDEATVKSLEEKIREVMQELLDQIRDRLNACKTLWDARALIRSIQGKISKLSFVPVWNGRQVCVTKVADYVLKGCEPYLEVYNRYAETRQEQWSRTLDIPCAHDTIIYVHKGDEPINRVRAKIVQDIKDKKLTGEVILAKFRNAQEIQAFVNHDEIVGANIVDLASMHCAPPKRKPSVHSNGAKTKKTHSTFVYNGNPYASPKSEAWEAKDIDVKEGEGVYVRIDGFIPVDSGLQYFDMLHALHEVIHSLSILTGVKTEIFGFRNNVSGLGDGWVPLRQKIEEVLKAELADPDFKAIAMSAWAEHEINSFFIAGAKYAKSVSAHGKMGQLLNRLAQLRSLSDKDASRLQAVQRLAMMVQMTEELNKLCEKEKAEFKCMEQAAKQAYPVLLMARGSFAWAHYKQEILEYIALVDKQ